MLKHSIRTNPEFRPTRNRLADVAYMSVIGRPALAPETLYDLIEILPHLDYLYAFAGQAYAQMPLPSPLATDLPASYRVVVHAHASPVKATQRAGATRAAAQGRSGSLLARCLAYVAGK